MRKHDTDKEKEFSVHKLVYDWYQKCVLKIYKSIIRTKTFQQKNGLIPVSGMESYITNKPRESY